MLIYGFYWLQWLKFVLFSLIFSSTAIYGLWKHNCLSVLCECVFFHSCLWLLLSHSSAVVLSTSWGLMLYLCDFHPKTYSVPDIFHCNIIIVILLYINYCIIHCHLQVVVHFLKSRRLRLPSNMEAIRRQSSFFMMTKPLSNFL